MRSKKFRTWKATLDLWICGRCFMQHGQIYEVGDWIEPAPPLHARCRCVIEALKARLAGTATKNGKDGADWWLKNTGKLPEYYVTQAEAKKYGYRPILGNLAQVLPGKMIRREYIKIEMDICLQLPVVFGMRRILTTREAFEEWPELSIPTMD